MLSVRQRKSHRNPRLRSSHMNQSLGVTARLVPAIHGFLAQPRKKDVDARDKRGPAGGEALPSHRNVP